MLLTLLTLECPMSIEVQHGTVTTEVATTTVTLTGSEMVLLVMKHLGVELPPDASDRPVFVRDNEGKLVATRLDRLTLTITVTQVSSHNPPVFTRY